MVALCAAIALPAGNALGADQGPYVALGDSYTAGPLIPNQVSAPLKCARSDHNYPSYVAAALGAASFTDVSCSSAETRHMTGSQQLPAGTHEPQFNGLRDDARLVTVGIGGNDAGLVGAAVKCVELGLLAPTGMACRNNYAPGGQDQIVAKIQATAPRIAAVLDGIRARAPLARIVLVGYPAVAPRDGSSCYPIVPLSSDDLRYFDGLLVQINAMLAEQATANGAEFADTFYESIGHDVCKLPGTKWFEGIVPTTIAYPIHPNALGMQSAARSVLRVLGSPRPGPRLSALARARRAVSRGRTARFSYRLDRAASVALLLQRATTGRRSGSVCRAPSAANRRAARCTRYVVATRMSASGAAGSNAVAVGAKAYGRRAGLYRLIVTPTSEGVAGGAQAVQFRVKR